MEDTRILSVQNVYDALDATGTIGTSVEIPENSDSIPATVQWVSDILMLPLVDDARKNYQISYSRINDIVELAKTSRYKRVEYLENNAKQFIDLEFQPTNLTSYILDAQIVRVNSTGDNHLMSENNIYGFAYRVSADKNSFSARWGSEGLKVVPHSGSITDRHIFKCDKGTFQCDNNATVTFKAATFTQPRSLALFCYTAANGTRSDFSFLRVYSLKIYENGELIRDMVPCYDSRDDVKGLYDFVRRKFTKNGGSGSFTLGPQIGSILDA